MEEGRIPTVVSAAPRRPVRAAAKRKPKRRVKWSKRRVAIFIETLGQLANVRDACRKSGLSDTTVYRRRRTDPEFLTQWQEALREGVARLEAEMLDRALNGVEKAVWHGGKKVGSVRHYNDGLALALLRAHGPTAGRAPPEPGEPPVDLAVWLGEMNRRMGGAG